MKFNQSIKCIHFTNIFFEHVLHSMAEWWRWNRYIHVAGAQVDCKVIQLFAQLHRNLIVCRLLGSLNDAFAENSNEGLVKIKNFSSSQAYFETNDERSVDDPSSKLTDNLNKLVLVVLISYRIANTNLHASQRYRPACARAPDTFA